MFMTFFSPQSTAMRVAIDQAVGKVEGRLLAPVAIRAGLHVYAIDHVIKGHSEATVRAEMIRRFEAIRSLRDDQCDALTAECVAAVVACHEACTTGTSQHFARIGAVG